MEELIADAPGLPLVFLSKSFNPSRRLFERLGFQAVSEDGFLLLFLRAAKVPDSPPAAGSSGRLNQAVYWLPFPVMNRDTQTQSGMLKIVAVLGKHCMHGVKLQCKSFGGRRRRKSGSPGLDGRFGNREILDHGKRRPGWLEEPRIGRERGARSEASENSPSTGTPTDPSRRLRNSAAATPPPQASSLSQPEYLPSRKRQCSLPSSPERDLHNCEMPATP